MKSYTTVGLGELLWDLLPSGKQLGGAPANFAYGAHLLGDSGIVASRIGRDGLGVEASQRLSSLGLDASFLQIDPTIPTGVVDVQVDPHGQPTFKIAEPSAWDFLQWNSGWQQLARKTDAVCFGSLAQRSAESRHTIRSFLQALPKTAARIFDVNLRQQFHSPEVISESLQLADVVKLNDAELPQVANVLGIEPRLGPANQESLARSLLQACGAKLVCVTRGERGSLLVDSAGSDQHPGFPVTVVDTVGAGDAFTAALVHHFLRGASLRMMNAAANRMGAWVASHAGATPAATAELLAQVLHPL